MGDLVECMRLLTCKIAYGRYDITSEMFQTKVCMNDLLHFYQVASVCPHFSSPEAYCNLFSHFVTIFAAVCDPPLKVFSLLQNTYTL